MSADINQSAQCTSCENVYQGSDKRLRCRINGLQAKPANSDGCKRFQIPSDSPAHRVWFCEKPGRGGPCA